MFVGYWVDLGVNRYISLLLFIGLAWGQEYYLEVPEEAMSRMGKKMVYIIDSVYVSQTKVTLKLKNSSDEILLSRDNFRGLSTMISTFSKGKKVILINFSPPESGYTLESSDWLGMKIPFELADDYEKRLRQEKLKHTRFLEKQEEAEKQESEKKRVAEVAAEKKAAAWEAKWAEKVAAKEAKRAEKVAAKEAAEELRKKNNPTLKEVMESWVGSHQSTLIKSWGPPDRTTSDGAGGNILIYNRGKGGSIITDNVQIPTTKLKGIIERPPYYEYDITTDNTYQRYRMFYVDDKGIIYYGKYQN